MNVEELFQVLLLITVILGFLLLCGYLCVWLGTRAGSPWWGLGLLFLYVFGGVSALLSVGAGLPWLAALIVCVFGGLCGHLGARAGAPWVSLILAGLASFPQPDGFLGWLLGWLFSWNRGPGAALRWGVVFVACVACVMLFLLTRWLATQELVAGPAVSKEDYCMELSKDVQEVHTHKIEKQPVSVCSLSSAVSRRPLGFPGV